MVTNNYYDIAMNDYKFLQQTIGLGFYNNTLPIMQQICEKMFKSILVDFDLVEVDSSIMRSRKLDRLFEFIKKHIAVKSDIRVGDLAWLTGFYFDCRYPGDNYIQADKSQEDEALIITNDVIKFVNCIRQNGIDYNNNETNYFNQ